MAANSPASGDARQGCWLFGAFKRFEVAISNLNRQGPGLSSPAPSIGCAGRRGPGLFNAVIAIALVSWVPFTRVTRIKDLPLRHRDFVQATIAIGSPRSCILRHHILPKLQTLLHLVHELKQNIALNFGVATAFSLLSGSSILFWHFKFVAVEVLAATQLLTGVGIASKPLLSAALTVPKNGSTLD